jgi:trehalose 2-sulfotransferase
VTALHKSYLICCVQRSGSWLLAHTLRDTGVAGRPSDYFDGAERDRNAARWGTPDFPSYLDAVLARGTTANGVFGSKMMWNDFGPFLASLRTLGDARSALSDRDLLEWAFPCLSFVWLRRTDKVRQGVSWWRAVVTDQWVRHPGEESKKADLDVSRILPLVQLAGEWDVAWREWFAEQRISPLEITYEQLDEYRLASVNH